MHTWIIFLVAVLAGLSSMAAAAPAKEKIAFVPLDVRPISFQQTAEVVEQLGCQVISPPAELFGNTKWNGDPDGILAWLEENSSDADAIVMSTDTLLYGGLIPSRKHEVPNDVLDSRMSRIEKLQQDHPNTNMYVFASLMRTPSSVPAGFDEEPEYYVTYGGQIFRLTMLYDKLELSGLSGSEEREMHELESSIPNDVLEDWQGRRAKNLSATKKLMDMVARGTLRYLIIGRDDNSPLCQTHRENRELLAYAREKQLPPESFQSLPGIDEFGLLLLAHAVNDLRKETPAVYVEYNRPEGSKRIPAYSDEPLGRSIESSVIVGGGRMTTSPKQADFVLMVNTDPDGKFHEPYNSMPYERLRLDKKKYAKNAESFAEKVDKYVEAGRPVGIADIMFPNGSDNDLMESMYRRGLLYRVQSYSGWNTPTNSSGFAIGMGMLTRHMSRSGKNLLLTRRYLDDWGYQANVRQVLADQFYNLQDKGASYYSLESDDVPAVEYRTTELMRDFAMRHLPPFGFLTDFYVTLPWSRMFECEIHFSEPAPEHNAKQKRRK